MKEQYVAIETNDIYTLLHRAADELKSLEEGRYLPEAEAIKIYGLVVVAGEFLIDAAERLKSHFEGAGLRFTEVARHRSAEPVCEVRYAEPGEDRKGK